MTSTPRIWRSMLFVPAHVDKYVDLAHTRGADAYILDLEDSVPAADKAKARDQLATGVARVTHEGGAALIRVNSPSSVNAADIEAACIAGVSAIVLPKVGRTMDVAAVATQLERLESERRLPKSSVGLIAMIESVEALPKLDDIATSSPRLLGMILGSEDFSESAGMDPIPEALFAPNQQVLFACRRAGILPFGFPASIADYSDLVQFRAHICLARRLGFVGAFCIHPSQVPILNEKFLPSPADIEAARGMIAAMDDAARHGLGAVSFRGKMIDRPIVTRAHEVLRRAVRATRTD
jgi:citrate lyase subunit beta / citryl-CoA lyase